MRERAALSWLSHGWGPLSCDDCDGCGAGCWACCGAWALVWVRVRSSDCSRSGGWIRVRSSDPDGLSTVAGGITRVGSAEPGAGPPSMVCAAGS